MRLAWARDHVTWTHNDWGQSCLQTSPGFVWTLPIDVLGYGECQMSVFAPVCVAEHDRFGGGSVMVWAGISAQGKTDLHVIDNGTLTALRYVNEILDVYVRPYAGAVGENFILMDDNARAHKSPHHRSLSRTSHNRPYGMAS